MIFIANNVKIDYDTKSSMSIVNVNAQWTEIGDGNNGNDLYLNGILKEEQ